MHTHTHTHTHSLSLSLSPDIKLVGVASSSTHVHVYLAAHITYRLAHDCPDLASQARPFPAIIREKSGRAWMQNHVRDISP